MQMDELIKSTLQLIQGSITILVLVCIDIPLKMVLSIVFFLLGIICSLLYPLTRKLVCPRCVGLAYEYLTTGDLIAARIYKAWNIED